MKKINLLVLMLVSLCIVAGCKKKIENSTSNTELIVGKNWKLTAYTINGADNYTAVYPACERDNIQVYTADGKYKVDEGATKCDANDPQTNEIGNWSIKDNNTLTFSQDGSSLQIVSTITELNDKTLQFSLKNPVGTENLIFTYTAQ